MKHLALLFLTGFLLSCSGAPLLEVRDSNGNPVPGTPYELVAMDDEGNTVSMIESGFTDNEGILRLDLRGAPSSSTVVRVFLPSGTLRTFAADQWGTKILDPISEAFVRAVLLVTETEGGRTLSDFSPQETQSLLMTARAELTDLEAETLADSDELLTALISAIGQNIAEASGGEMTAVPLANVESANEVTNGPTIDSSPATFCGSDHTLLLGDLFYFDIQPDGSLCNIESENGALQDAFDTGLSLQLVDENFGSVNFFPGDNDTNSTTSAPSITTEDDREIVFGPVDSASGNLRATRKLFVPEGSDYIRHLEILENIGSSDLTITIRVSGELGLDSVRVLALENEGLSLDETHAFGAFIPSIPNSDSPTVGFVLDGAFGQDMIDQAVFPPDSGATDVFSFSWQLVELSPGEKKVFAHFTTVSGSQNEETVRDVLSDLHENPDLAGLSGEELNTLQNFSANRGNLVGEAGSVASYALLTITGADGDNATVQARSDGSFFAAIAGESGDDIQVVGDDGTNVSLTIE